MKAWSRTIAVIVLCGMMGLLPGCVCSLFSDDHKHYHDGVELRERVENVEKRLDVLEGKKSGTLTESEPATQDGGN